MTSPQHAKWIRSGLQWQLSRPLVALRDRLRRYGYTVYDIGDTRHLDHIPPEDHTPYSETGWPGTTPYGWVTAIDIMPPGSGLPSLQALCAQIYADRMAGVDGIAWLKYMNWGPVNDRSAVQDRWKPSHVRGSSGDVGHGHLSGRSDHVLSATQAELDYDPVARLRGGPAATSGRGDDMIYRTPNGACYVATNNGPVQVLAAELESMASPQVMQVASFDRVKEYCPAVPGPASVSVEVAGDELGSALLAVLESADGQAALIKAVNTAEDS